MFSFFEKLLEPFPPELPTRPPSSFLAFCRHYTQGVWHWIFLMSLLVTLVAAVEVLLFGFLGNVIDWLAEADKETFLAQEGDTLMLIGAVVLIALPLLSLLAALVKHQTILGNYPMRIRWQAHRYLLRQSFGFYQDEMAGRVATKVMQTALGVREAVLKLADVMVYVGVYFLGGLILVVGFDVWMVLPFIVWLLAYIALMVLLLPRLNVVAQQQADALENFTLNIAAGEKVGIVGRSGAGKTTLMNILLRLFDLQSGRILIDGHNLEAPIRRIYCLNGAVI